MALEDIETRSLQLQQRWARSKQNVKVIFNHFCVIVKFSLVLTIKPEFLSLQNMVFLRLNVI